MLRRLFISGIALFMATYCRAQSSHWFAPLNHGLLAIDSSSGRYDDVYFISHDTGVLVSSYGILFKTYDAAQHWTIKNVSGPSVYYRSVEFSSDGQIGISGTVSGYVYRSSDRGETWTDISSSIADTGADARRICGLGHYGNNFFGVGWWGGNVARFFKSTDGGLTWSTSYLDTGLATGLVDITFFSATKGFITGCRKYGTKRESVVLRTLDGGTTWDKVFSDTIIGGRIWKIQFIDSTYGVGSVEPMYDDTVSFIRTTDGGNTWQLYPIGHVNAWSFAGIGTQGIGFLDRDHGWVGGYYNGMFQTSDGGMTWTFVNINEECDRFFLIDGTIYVSANTVYEYGHPSLEQVIPVSAPVYQHKLYPIVPNPSDGIVHIDFDINGHQTNTVLEVSDIAARRTYRIMNGYLTPGHYSYQWDGRGMPNGNYIVWLGTDEIPMAQKFVLRK